MTNNDILRRIRYTFNYDDPAMIAIFDNVNIAVDDIKIKAWLTKEEEEGYLEMKDVELAQFLNGFIIEKRGPKGDSIPQAEEKLSNNIILRKLKIALNLRDDDMLELFQLADLRVSKPELSSFFRKVDHKHYRECKNQFLRNFLMGMQLKYRPK